MKAFSKMTSINYNNSLGVSEKGIYGGFLPTKDLFGHYRLDEIPFLNRDIIPDTTRPQIGKGTNRELSNQNLMEGILRPIPTTTGTKATKWNEPTHPIALQYLPYEWQRPDYRPTYFLYHPRQSRERISYYTI